MKIKIHLIFLILTCFLSWGSTFAQEEIFAPGFQLGSGARSIAMGGAFTALGGDYSASLSNPATLTDIRRVEFFGALSYLSRGNTFTLNQNLGAFSNAATETDENFTNLSTVGIAYPVPTYRGSLVLGFGYHRVKSFDSSFEFGTFNQTDDDLVNQAWKEIEQGSINAWILSGAMDISPSTSLGISLNFWTGGSRFTSTFREVDIDNNFPEFVDFTEDNSLNTDISGFNVKLGLVHRLGNFMRFGFTASSPTTFKVEEDWSVSELINRDDGATEDFFDEGIFDYKIRSPWSFSTGAAVNLLGLTVSGDLEFTDWSQVRYKTEPPVEGLTEIEANRIIHNEYGQRSSVDFDDIGVDINFTVPTPRVRLGAEFTLPLTDLSFRAGYFRDPSVFKDSAIEEDKQFYSAGLGFLLDRQVKLDIAFVHGFWKSFNSGLPQEDDISGYVEDIKVNKVFVSVAFRF